MSVSINNLMFPKTANPESDIRSRIKSSVHSRHRHNDKTHRPKSSPIKLNPEGLESFYLSKRNKTAPVLIDRSCPSTCERAVKSELGHIKSYSFPASSVKKYVPQTNTINKSPDETRQVYNLGPGYVIFRNESEFAIRIDSDQFFGMKKETERKESTKIHIKDHKDMIINQLQEQISNLNVFLEEEKLNHNLTLAKAQEQLDFTRKTLTENYNIEIKNLKEDHMKQLKKIEKENNKNLKQQQEEFEEKLSKALQELNVFKASFDSYRQSLIKETDKRIELEKNELSSNFQEEITEKLKKQKRELKMNYEVDIENLKEEHLSEIEKINSKHMIETEVLNKRFAGFIAVEEKLSQTLQELEKKKRDYQRLQTEYENLHQTYVKSRKELTIALNANESLKLDIQEFSDRFEERVKRVDDDYKEKIDLLQNQIVEIRRAYLSKCEELVEERKRWDSGLQGRIETAKDVMKEIIHTRQRARISLVSLESDSDMESIHRRIQANESPSSNDQSGKSRPVSAPTTDHDEKIAKQKSFVINKDVL